MTRKPPAVPHVKGLTESVRFDRIGWVEDESTGCWNWRGYVSPKGYGRFRSGATGDLAHRFALYRELGRPLREGISVLHSCDNGRCVNPEHLSEGTHEQNMIESVQRGRKPTKLTPEDVMNVYERSRDGSSTVNGLAREFKVVPAAIRAIRDGRNWKWLTQGGDK